MALLIYDQYFPYIFPTNGTTIGALAHASSVKFSTENKDVDVETLFLEFSGITPSPKKGMASFDLFDPISGSILGLLQRLENDCVECKVVIAKRGTPEKWSSQCFLRNVSGNGGVGESSKISFDTVGTPTSFQ